MVYLMKRVNGNWNIIDKNGYCTFNTAKSGNFNSLRFELLHYNIFKLLHYNSAKKMVMVINNILQMICVGYALEAPESYQQTLLQKLK